MLESVSLKLPPLPFKLSLVVLGLNDAEGMRSQAMILWFILLFAICGHL